MSAFPEFDGKTDEEVGEIVSNWLSSPATSFDFTSMAEDLPKAPEPEKPRRLHEDIPPADWQKAIRAVMTPKWMEY